MIPDFIKNLPMIRDFFRHVLLTYDELDFMKSRLDVPDALFREYQECRYTEAYRAAYEKESPLVSVCVATYNRAALLRDRCLKSLLAQDYTNIEIVVVGDACTDDTQEAVHSLADPRISFHNLSQRGDYPVDPRLRWMVAGTTPMNHALKLSRGDFITHLDDDDEFYPDRIRRLIDFIKSEQVDIVWHPFYRELPSGRWEKKRAGVFARNNVTTSSVLYHSWFRKVPWDINAYLLREPGDWNRFRKFKYLAAKAAYYPEPLLRHYRERNQAGATR